MKASFKEYRYLIDCRSAGERKIESVRCEDAFVGECQVSFEQVFKERVHQLYEKYRVTEVHGLEGGERGC